VIDKAGYLSGSALTLCLSILSYRIVSYRMASNYSEVYSLKSSAFSRFTAKSPHCYVVFRISQWITSRTVTRRLDMQYTTQGYQS